MVKEGEMLVAVHFVVVQIYEFAKVPVVDPAVAVVVEAGKETGKEQVGESKNKLVS